MLNTLTRLWRQQTVGIRLLPLVAASAALTGTGAALPTQVTSSNAAQVADITITAPIIIVPDYPVIVAPRRQRRREVKVRFVAQGDDWATIYLDDRLLFRAANTRRDHEVTLDAGAYRLQITGVSRFDVWDSGYLDLGRNDTNVVVIRYGKQSGIRAAADPYAWIPD